MWKVSCGKWAGAHVVATRKHQQNAGCGQLRGDMMIGMSADCTEFPPLFSPFLLFPSICSSFPLFSSFFQGGQISLLFITKKFPSMPNSADTRSSAVCGNDSLESYKNGVAHTKMRSTPFLYERACDGVSRLLLLWCFMIGSQWREIRTAPLSAHQT